MLTLSFQRTVRFDLHRPKETCKENGNGRTEGSTRGKRALEDEEDGNSDSLSKNKQKKKLRNPNKSFDPSLKRKMQGSSIYSVP